MNLRTEQKSEFDYIIGCFDETADGVKVELDMPRQSGKSMIVAHVAAKQFIRGQKVLIVTYNHKCAQIMKDRIKSILTGQHKVFSEDRWDLDDGVAKITITQKSITGNLAEDMGIQRNTNFKYETIIFDDCMLTSRDFIVSEVANIHGNDVKILFISTPLTQ